jgi:hypothetical protein
MNRFQTLVSISTCAATHRAEHLAPDSTGDAAHDVTVPAGEVAAVLTFAFDIPSRAETVAAATAAVSNMHTIEGAEDTDCAPPVPSLGKERSDGGDAEDEEDDAEDEAADLVVLTAGASVECAPGTLGAACDYACPGTWWGGAG